MPVVPAMQPFNSRPTIRHLLLLLFLTLSGVLPTGCQQPVETALSGETQGTTWHLKMVLDGVQVEPARIQAEVEALFRQIDDHFSTWREDSELSRFNQAETTEHQPVSADLIHLTRLARQIHDRTGGCYDPTVQPLSELWGFARDEQRVPAAAEIQAILAHVGMDKLEIDTAGNRLRKRDNLVKLSLDSIAQGYTIAGMARILEGHGIHNYLAEIGGEMKVKGRKANGAPWRVAVEKPTPMSREVQRILELRQTEGVAVMTSGTYRNYFEADGQTYSHILDPRTGMPVTHRLLSTTILHPDPTLADAWSTALLCLGEMEGPRVAEAEGLEVLFIYREGDQIKEKMTGGFAAQTSP